MTDKQEKRPASGRSVRQGASDAARRAGRFGKQVNTARVNAWHPALEPSQSMAPRAKGRIDTVVFGISAVLALAFIAWGTFGTASLGSAAASGLDFVVSNTGWLFALVASGFVIFVIWLAAGKYGRVPLGSDSEGPEFSTISWIAMMFSAGMGIGLVFYGVTEPLSHFVTPPPGTSEAGAAHAVQTAMATTMFHWSLHPWAIYAVLGLAVGYGVYRKGRSLLISDAFIPILGKRAKGPVGKTIDIFAIFATLFGSATSLGLGALQIGSGLEIVGGIGKVGNGVLIAIIVALTILFVLSAVSGVARGIQWLSNINMVLALVLALFVFVVGPTVFILDLIPTTIGAYFDEVAAMAARTEAAGGSAMAAWLGEWTIFYWAWWVSWTPFVGMFIARISRGRTIREFVTGVLLVPSAVSLVWFAIFGGTGIKMQQDGVDIASKTLERTLFAMLAELPWAQISSITVMILVAIFFVSGADAASIVMGTLSERGALEPSRKTVIFWGAATGAVAAIMLLVGGKNALSGLQNITIIAALPFVVIMVGLAAALVKDLRSDPMVVRRQYAVAAVEQAVVDGVTDHGDDFALSVRRTEPGSGVGELVDTDSLSEQLERRREAYEAEQEITSGNKPEAEQ